MTAAAPNNAPLTALWLLIINGRLLRSNALFLNYSAAFVAPETSPAQQLCNACQAFLATRSPELAVSVCGVRDCTGGTANLLIFVHLLFSQLLAQFGFFFFLLQLGARLRIHWMHAPRAPLPWRRRRIGLRRWNLNSAPHFFRITRRRSVCSLRWSRPPQWIRSGYAVVPIKPLLLHHLLNHPRLPCCRGVVARRQTPN